MDRASLFEHTWIDAEWDPVPGAEEYRLSINGALYPPFEASTQSMIPVPRGSYYELQPSTTYTIGVSVCKIVGVSFVCSAEATLTVTTEAG